MVWEFPRIAGGTIVFHGTNRVCSGASKKMPCHDFFACKDIIKPMGHWVIIGFPADELRSSERPFNNWEVQPRL